MTHLNTLVRHNEKPEALSFDDYLSRETKHIVSSKTFHHGKWRDLTRVKGAPAGVTKVVLPIDLTSFSLTAIITVAPKTKVARHAHYEGALVRYITSGSLMLNGVSYQAGDWIYIPKGGEYEIETVEGYTAINHYDECKCCQ